MHPDRGERAGLHSATRVIRLSTVDIIGCLAPMMSEYTIPEPEPKEVDEKTSIELRILANNAVLKGRPSAEEKCGNCRYYLEPWADVAYCWHPKLRILVGEQWWCQWWDAIPAE